MNAKGSTEKKNPLCSNPLSRTPAAMVRQGAAAMSKKRQADRRSSSREPAAERGWWEALGVEESIWTVKAFRLANMVGQRATSMTSPAKRTRTEFS